MKEKFKSYSQIQVIIRTFILLFFAFMSFGCKNENVEEEKENYRYDKSLINYSINMLSVDDLHRISLLLDNENQKIIVLAYNKMNKNYEEAEFKINAEEKILFIKVVEDQIKIENSFHRIIDLEGFDTSFEMNMGGSSLISKYKNVVNFEQDISLDFSRLILMLKKEKLVSSFLKK